MNDGLKHAVPLTVEGSSVLHQMFHFRRPQWRALTQEQKLELLAEAVAMLEQVEGANSAAYSLIGHKGDLMLVHFRRSFEELKSVELRLQNLRLFDFLAPATSYLSVVELGLYESTSKVHNDLEARGIEFGTPEWQVEIEATLARQREAMAPRLYPVIPSSRYLCFYPMDRKRGETLNWYRVPMEDRQRLMHDHGMIGRRYAGQVKQIISGSIGFDDWEWGVDLFAAEPLVFKRLIYEMRFDEVSALYASFGGFYVGIRIPARSLGDLLEGQLPAEAEHVLV